MQNSKPIKIVAVTKTHTFSAIASAVQNKVIDIGENKVQETEKKLQNQKKPLNAKLHFIGHLQKNKAKKAVQLYDYIQTVDSISLAKRINKISKEQDKIQKVFLQINIGNKKNKHGFLTEEIEEAASTINSFYNIKIKGIMIIPPLTESKKEYIRYFKKAKKIKDALQKKIKTCTNLSMGMSSDYVEAIKAGATHIRLGTALFGERQK